MSRTAMAIPPDVLKVLALPSLAGLSEYQVRGITCVWDGVALATSTAVDLGAQTANRAGEPLQWYPRACRNCVAERAHRALNAHAPLCKDCVHKAGRCPVGSGLYRLMRETRR
jgi:hypothetical protein